MHPKTKLSCRNVWKLYGGKADAILQRTPSPSGEDLSKEGVTGAVRNANIDIAEGEIIQMATPQELVLNPATDYVSEFTRNISRSKVRTVGGMMTKALNGVKEPIGRKRLVADETGEIVGSIDRAAITHVPFGDGGAR